MRRDREEGEVGISAAIHNFITIVAQHLRLPSKKLDKIVRLYAHAPTCLIIRADNTMFVILYVFGRFAESPTLKLRPTPGGLFETYLNHFESTWEHSHSIQLLETGSWPSNQKAT